MEEKIEDKKPVVQDVSIVERAEAAAKRLEEANKKQEELILAQEQIRARELLGGRALAGSSQPVVDKEKERRETVKNFWKDSAIGPAVEKYLSK